MTSTPHAPSAQHRTAADRLFGLGRRLGKRGFVTYAFCAIQPLLPVRRVAGRSGVTAFHHPRPIAEPHILVVPTRPIRSLTNTAPAHRIRTLSSMIELAAQIGGLQWTEGERELIINGGTRQDIGHLHGHLLPRSERQRGRHYLVPISDADDQTEWHQLLGDIEQLAADPSLGYSVIARSGTSTYVEITLDDTRSQAPDQVSVQ